MTTISAWRSLKRSDSIHKNSRAWRKLLREETKTGKGFRVGSSILQTGQRMRLQMGFAMSVSKHSFGEIVGTLEFACWPFSLLEITMQSCAEDFRLRALPIGSREQRPDLCDKPLSSRPVSPRTPVFKVLQSSCSSQASSVQLSGD
jgi:hypothetical protein